MNKVAIIAALVLFTQVVSGEGRAASFNFPRPMTSSAQVLNGKITGPASFGFDLNSGRPHGIVPVIVSQTTAVTYNGLRFSSGVSATVTGTFNASGWLAATSVVLSSGEIPAHVVTYGYLGGYYGTHNITWLQAAPYLTWASTQAPDSIGIHAVGIKTLFYSDPTRVQANDPLYNTSETSFAHDCTGHRITRLYKGIIQYVMDPSSSSLRSSFASIVVNPTLAAGRFDAIYEDNAGPLSEYNINTFSSVPCGYSDASWAAADAGLEAVQPVPVFFNGLSGLNPYGGYNMSLSTGLFQDARTTGGNYEHCYTQDSPSFQKYFGLLWQAVENTEIYVAQQGRNFICNPTDNYGPPGSPREIDDRIYSYASFLLTYDLNTSIMWARYPVGASGFTVNPESQLVAENPVLATPTNVGGLLTSTGVYGREYNSCYVAGVSVGPCAAIVNPDYYRAHTFPYTKYHHTLVLTGASILDGGTLSVSGPAPVTPLAPLASAIVFQ